MTRRVVGPFNRVEGDLEIALDVDDGVVREAYVNAPLYRGFEQMLVGKAPADALVFVPRICGICSVAQSAAAAAALAQASGIQPPPNGRLAANLTQAAENIADHLTHFYLFFMPDFAHGHYAGEPWHAAAHARFAALTGSAAAEAQAARTAFMRTMGLLAGKWPHTLALQPGGSSRALQGSERIRLVRLVRELRAFLERTLYGDSLEAVAALASADALAAWAAPRAAQADFPRFLALADAAGLARLGRSNALLMSAGAYPGEGGHLFARGVHDGAPGPLDPDAIREDLSHARYAAGPEPQPPAHGATLPLHDKPGAYSWCKAPRLAGRVAETGAWARQVIDGHPLALDLAARGGSTVRTRIVGRMLELARLVPAMEQWADQLRPGEPYAVVGALPDSAEGHGLVEAARGTLGHWLGVRRGRIHHYQVIAPTTWNFSPRDAAGNPGAVEHALAGTPAASGDGVHPAVYHVVRSFDPCMVCTVH